MRHFLMFLLLRWLVWAFEDMMLVEAKATLQTRCFQHRCLCGLCEVVVERCANRRAAKACPKLSVVDAPSERFDNAGSWISQHHVTF